MRTEILARLKNEVGPAGFVEAAGEIAPHLEEWRSKYKGHSPLLLKPASTKEVSAILAICNESGTAVVPQGGNTGLVGGQIPFDGEVLLNLTRMAKIDAPDVEGRTILTQAGAILANVQRAADERGLLFPLSLAAEGSCTIGGNLSTNAGGVNVLRYGMARDLVLGIEVVLSDGRILDLMRTLRKDNTGYDLKQLFIGAEGTLGVITAAALKLFARPERRATSFVAVTDVNQALALLSRLQGETGGLLTAFELIPRLGIEFVLAHIPGAREPLGATSPWYVLLEATSGSRFDLDKIIEDSLAAAIADGTATDATIARSSAQRAAFWQLRENLSEAQKREGPSLKHDIAVPLAAIPDFLREATSAVLAIIPEARPMSFGHLGDGNIHFNFSAAKTADAAAFLARWDEVQRIVHDIVARFGGSFSAEHGIGVMKRSDLGRYKSAVEIDLMRTLKRTLDPKNILNPGKLLPA